MLTPGEIGAWRPPRPPVHRARPPGPRGTNPPTGSSGRPCLPLGRFTTTGTTGIVARAAVRAHRGVPARSVIPALSTDRLSSGLDGLEGLSMSEQNPNEQTAPSLGDIEVVLVSYRSRDHVEALLSGWPRDLDVVVVDNSGN